MPEESGYYLVFWRRCFVFASDIAISGWLLWRKYQGSMVMVFAEYPSDIVINYWEHVYFREYSDNSKN
ncbi:MAG: hypothetical protein D3904_01520 [Candidatus Electrothrix sp. EH2]|nr:hypothetical protein [Candidatus Electrothrix sp. EH2]